VVHAIDRLTFGQQSRLVSFGDRAAPFYDPADDWAVVPMTPDDKQRIADELEARELFERARERADRREQETIRKEIGRQRQQDMGVGYLIYVARRHGRLSQGDLARRMRTSQASISTWEAGRQLPTLWTMERVAIATGLQLLIGLKHPDEDDVIALGIVDDERNMTKLEMIVDFDSQRPIRPTGWRERLRRETGR
jgi:DNA-binding transcriptional regulator YiaG